MNMALDSLTIGRAGMGCHWGQVLSLGLSGLVWWHPILYAESKGRADGITNHVDPSPPSFLGKELRAVRFTLAIELS